MGRYLKTVVNAAEKCMTQLAEVSRGNVAMGAGADLMRDVAERAVRRADLADLLASSNARSDDDDADDDGVRLACESPKGKGGKRPRVLEAADGCQFVLKGGVRRGQLCGRPLPCAYHKPSPFIVKREPGVVDV